MRKILLVDDNSAIAQELAKLLKRRGYGVQIAATVAGAKEVIEKESPLFICSDLDLPDGSGLELLDMVRAADADIPFLIAYCHDPSHYEAEAVRRGVTLCLDKTRINFVADKLIEYAYRQSCGEAQSDFHNKQADGCLPVQDSRSIIFCHNNKGGGAFHAAYCHLRR